jgi:cysteine desulfuration protein SufE
MSEASEFPPAQGRLGEIVAEFTDAEPRERLEMLRDFADAAPPLPEHLKAERDAGTHRVHECMTPTFLWVDVKDGRVVIHADVAPEAPTVRGFVALLCEAFNGAPPEEILTSPQNLIHQLGLMEILGMNRMRGLHAILYRIRQEVGKAVAKNS